MGFLDKINYSMIVNSGRCIVSGSVDSARPRHPSRLLAMSSDDRPSVV